MSTGEDPEEPPEFFLSHNWGEDTQGRDNHERVCKVNTALKVDGFKTWCDVDRMSYGIDTLEAMTSGIEGSKIVLVFVTKKYMEKVGQEFDNCKYEFDHAFLSKKTMIPIVMEAACYDVKNEWFGRVKAALGTKLYLDFSDNSKFDEFMTNLKTTLTEKVGQPSTGNSCVPNAPCNLPPPAIDIERAHAYFLMLQPSSTPLSSYFKLETELNRIKSSIEEKNENELAIILRGGGYQDMRPIATAKIVILCAHGIDEDALHGDDNYLRTIVGMQPKVVLLCMTHGAERIGKLLSDSLSQAEMDTEVCWVRTGMNHVDLQDLFKEALLPFCEDLLLRQETIASSFASIKEKRYCQENPFEYGPMPSSDAPLIPMDKLDPCIEVKMTGCADLIGFQKEELGNAVYRHSYLPLIDDIKAYIRDGQKQGAQRNSPRFIHIKNQMSGKRVLNDLMRHVCISLVEDEESVRVERVYRVSPTSESTPSEEIVTEDELYARIGGQRDMVVFIDGMLSIFPQVKDFEHWLDKFKSTGVTFLLSSMKDDDDKMEPYIEVLDPYFDVTVPNIPDLAGHQTHPTPYQATIKVLRGSFSDSPNLQEQIASLKKFAADLTGSISPRTNVICADDGSIHLQVNIWKIEQLKHLFHAVFDQQAQAPGQDDIELSIAGAMTLYQEAALQLNTLNSEQVTFLEKKWKRNNRVVHLKGAAGTGKTFVALHCVLEHLTDRSVQSDRKKTLLVFPTSALCYAFTRWLLARVKQNMKTKKRQLQNINFLILNEGECKTVEIDISNRGDLDFVEISIKDYSDFGLIIVDESHEFFRSDSRERLPPTSLLDVIKNAEDDRTRVLLLSDTSQAESTEDQIAFPTVDDTFQLSNVSRCSENITAATIPYQLGEKSKCEHGIRGPQVKVDIFDVKGDLPGQHDSSSLPNAIFDEYAAKLDKIFDNIIWSFKKEDGGAKNLHRCVAVAVPDVAFRQSLENSGIFERKGLKPITAIDAMKKSGADESQPWIVVDTPSNLNGLEFLFVIVTGMDSPIDEGEREGGKNKKTQSSIYRCMSRGQYFVYILNHRLGKDSWFEWLKLVPVPKKKYRRKKVVLASEKKSDFDQMTEQVVKEGITNLVSKKQDESWSKGWLGKCTEVMIAACVPFEKNDAYEAVETQQPLRPNYIRYGAFDTSACNDENILNANAVDPNDITFFPAKNKNDQESTKLPGVEDLDKAKPIPASYANKTDDDGNPIETVLLGEKKPVQYTADGASYTPLSVEMRGITLRQLRAVRALAEEKCIKDNWVDWKGKPITPDKVTLYDINKYIIMPFTEHTKKSFVESLPSTAGTQPPRLYVIHWWGQPFPQLLDCIERFVLDFAVNLDDEDDARGGGMTEDTPIWISAFANNQWALEEDMATDPQESSFVKAMRVACFRSLCVVDANATVFTRIWVVFECFLNLILPMNDPSVPGLLAIYTAIRHYHDGEDRAAVGIIPGGAPNESTVETSERESHFPPELVSKSRTIDIATAEASVPEDGIRILNSIVKSKDLNAPPPTTHANYVSLNDSVKAAFVSSQRALDEAHKAGGEEWKSTLEILSKGKMTEPFELYFDRFSRGLSSLEAHELMSHLPLTCKGLDVRGAGGKDGEGEGAIDGMLEWLAKKEANSLAELICEDCHVGDAERGRVAGSRLAAVLASNHAQSIKLLVVSNTDLIDSGNVQDWAVALTNMTNLNALYFERAVDLSEEEKNILRNATHALHVTI